MSRRFAVTSSLRAKMRNNRIGKMDFLNQYCALAPDFESILLARACEIVLQQNLPEAGIPWASRCTAK
jgi:hypothetical protein